MLMIAPLMKGLPHGREGSMSGQLSENLDVAYCYHGNSMIATANLTRWKIIIEKKLPVISLEDFSLLHVGACSRMRVQRIM